MWGVCSPHFLVFVRESSHENIRKCMLVKVCISAIDPFLHLNVKKVYLGEQQYKIVLVKVYLILSPKEDARPFSLVASSFSFFVQESQMAFFFVISYAGY